MTGNALVELHLDMFGEAQVSVPQAWGLVTSYQNGCANNLEERSAGCYCRHGRSILNVLQLFLQVADEASIMNR